MVLALGRWRVNVAAPPRAWLSCRSASSVRTNAEENPASNSSSSRAATSVGSRLVTTVVRPSNTESCRRRPALRSTGRSVTRSDDGVAPGRAPDQVAETKRSSSVIASISTSIGSVGAGWGSTIQL